VAGRIVAVEAVNGGPKLGQGQGRGLLRARRRCGLGRGRRAGVDLVREAPAGADQHEQKAAAETRDGRD